MKKISQINWKRYKESEAGKDAIAQFEKCYSSEITFGDLLELVKRFNPDFTKNSSKREENAQINAIGYFNEELNIVLQNGTEGEPYADIFVRLSEHMVSLEKEEFSGVAFEDLPQTAFKNLLNYNTFISLLLYLYMPGFFIPNLFVMQFAHLQRLADKYDIELPEVPNRADYKDRWIYYFELCCVLNDFAIDNDIINPAEFCAFLFDYELPLIKEELELESTKDMPEHPSQAWIIVGNYGDAEKDMAYGFWQANQMTEKGDLLLFYEKSPVKALNSIWIAQQDGVVDPFFRYYSNTYIGNKITIPADQAITYADFKNSEYFQNRDKKGNFVSKNFQDCSGWQVRFDDYQEILRMLESKGFDTSVLPKLYEPTAIGDITIDVENDVSEKLLIPLLEQMGWENGVDFRREVEFNAGRTTTNHSSDKRPDFCLHIKEKNDDIEAKVVIEVKKHMKSQKELHDNFVQGRSYAKWGGVKVLVLVDMKQILVYEQDKNGAFDEKKPKKFSWADMENPDKYAELKMLLS